MPLLSWNDSYSVDDDLMDNQHRRLMSIINRLHEAMKAGQAQDKLDQVLAELQDYTKTHFTEEEELLKRIDYPKLYSHKLVHDKFIKKIDLFVSDIKNGKPLVSIDIKSYLVDWLINHITIMDKQYATYILENAALTEHK